MIRLDMIFNYKTSPAAGNAANSHTRPQRQGGWTESLIFMAGLDSDPNTTYANLRQKRMAMLGRGSSMIAMRQNLIVINNNKVTVQQIQLTPIPAALQANSNFQQDIANACLDIQMGSPGVKNTRKFRLGGIPDDWITGGEWDVGAGGETPLQQYLFVLFGNARFMGRVLDPIIAPRIPILQGIVNVVTQTIVFTMARAVGGDIAIGDFVTPFRCRDNNNKRVTGQLPVTNVVGNQVTVFPYIGTTNIGQVGSLARVRLDTFPINNQIRYFAGTHKIGRPFDVFHGRLRRK